MQFKLKKTFLVHIALLLIPFIVSQIVLATVLQYMHYNYFNPENWARFDSWLYLQIADTGYEIFPCAGHFGYPADATEICGNCGWFPGYPLLISFFGLFFKNTLIIAGLLSKIFHLLSLYMLIGITNMQIFSLKNILILTIAAFSFSFVYFNAIFPISALLFFSLSAFYFYLKNNSWVTGLFCFLSSAFYPVGILLSAVFALSILLKINLSLKKRITSLMIPATMGLLGFVFVLLFFQITVNDWAAFFKVQAKYGHGYNFPLVSMVSFFQKKPLFSNVTIESFVQYQSLLIIMGYTLLSIIFFYKRMYTNDFSLWVYIFISVFFLFSWSIEGDLSRYRQEALLMPFVLLVKETKIRWLAVILLWLLAMGIPISYLFFNGSLI